MATNLQKGGFHAEYGFLRMSFTHKPKCFLDMAGL